MRIHVLAPAKINLSLDIIGRRNDGYHTVKMIMQSVDLCDTVSVWQAPGGTISITCSDVNLPTGTDNTVYQAAKAFWGATGEINPGIGIHIEKQIPVLAGLAGGSTDAAAVILALNTLLSKRLSLGQMMEIGKTVGADVPFCFLGGGALAEGIGTKLTPLPSMPDCTIVIAKPKMGVSTQAAYQRFDQADDLVHPDALAMSNALKSGNLAAIASLTGNIFEQLTDIPDIEAIKIIMRQHDCLSCTMTGSGPSVFGIFTDHEKARHCAQSLRQIYSQVFVCHPLPYGCTVKK